MPADVLAFACPALRSPSLQCLLDDVLTDAWSARQGGDAVLDAVERLADALSQLGADTSSAAVLPALNRAHLWLCHAHIASFRAALEAEGDVPAALDRVEALGGMLRRIWSLEDWLRWSAEGDVWRKPETEGFWRWAVDEIE